MGPIHFYLEVLEAIALGVFTLGSGIYLKELNTNKKQRKLSTFEYTMYILIGAAFLVIIIKYLTDPILE
ncbi:hypothetical protein GCM10028778_25520 [Barrientosiimonas marina]|uniref:Uncharacterized protein n=1 Tax=Lentibacillus kimchii TaxID=1542911 RepID=A0ABW2UT09_9BACI